MTDKQIIIDGVDVSGCVNLRLEANTAETSYYNACSIGLWQRWYSNLEPSCQMSCHCKNNKDCYYKKWQRKEQECEKLKKQACGLRPELKYIIDKTCSNYNINSKYYHEKIVEIINKLDKLKAENEELKKQLQKYKDNYQQEKEMQQLYNKLNGSSLIEKRNPYEN